MKLSVRKRFGWIHVRGGRVLRVVKPHAVRTSGRSAYADEEKSSHEPPRWKAGEKWVYTEEGDVAVEIVAVKTGKVLGHSYLSGPAIQLNGYTPFEEDWFEEAKGTFVEVPHPDGGKLSTEFIENVIGMFMGVKYSKDAVLGAFVYECTKGEDMRDVAEGLTRMWSYEHDTDESTAHLLGLVKGHPKGVVIMHFQPTKHASDFAATGFQIELVLGAVGAPT
jgi:hypothetical protein